MNANDVALSLMAAIEIKMVERSNSITDAHFELLDGNKYDDEAHASAASSFTLGYQTAASDLQQLLISLADIIERREAGVGSDGYPTGAYL